MKRLHPQRNKKFIPLRVLGEYYGLTTHGMRHRLKQENIDPAILLRDVYALFDYIQTHPVR